MYCADNGCPAKSIHLMCGLLILKHVRNHLDAIEAHNRLLEKEEVRERERKQRLAAESDRQQEKEEKEALLQALKQTGNNKRKAAKLLGIGKSTLYNKLKALQLDVPE